MRLYCEVRFEEKAHLQSFKLIYIFCIERPSSCYVYLAMKI